MPPRGIVKGSKRARQYEHIKDSLEERGRSEAVAGESAARTVNKERASKISPDDISSGRRGGPRSSSDRPRGRTRDQLYAEARKLGIAGRSYMTKGELERAVESRAR